MLRENKGVTILSLIIIIIVMIIILSITIITADELLRKTDINKLKTNLYLIQARAETLLDDYLFDGTDELGDSVSVEDVSKFGWEESTLENGYQYRKWGIEKLKAQGIDTSNMDHNEEFMIKYDINNEEVDVASYRGVVDVDGEHKYTLSSLEEN